jgi:hypothetical protein
MSSVALKSLLVQCTDASRPGLDPTTLGRIEVIVNLPWRTMVTLSEYIVYV